MVRKDSGSPGVSFPSMKKGEKIENKDGISKNAHFEGNNSPIHQIVKLGETTIKPQFML